MRGFVVYESLFGNTFRIAQAIADGMGKRLEVELRNVTERVQPGEVDLLVMGGPTHGFSMSRPATREDAVSQGSDADASVGLREWLDELPEGDDLPFATFDTRVDIVRRLPGSAAKTAAKAARRRGYVLLTRPESFYVKDTKGPLLDGEVQRAGVWGAQLTEALIGEMRDWG
jgi:hypothetical protein